MEIYSSLHIGDFHINYCEDFLIHEPLTGSHHLVAVMDGCTMGKESAFASMLIGKLLRKIATSHYYQDFATPGEYTTEALLKQTTKSLFTELITAKNQLMLDKDELLSTLLLCVADHQKQNASVIAVGDGLVVYDGHVREFEQNNIPDYLGYHLAEDFDSWYEKHDQKIAIDSFTDLSLATDGIFTFQNNSKTGPTIPFEEIIEYLLLNRDWSENNNMLKRKVRWLKEERQHVVTDDLAMIRILL